MIASPVFRGPLAGLLAAALVLLAGSAAAEGDPWQPMNRALFRFNEAIDIHAVEPVARGWRFVTPAFLRTAIGNLADHLQMPIVLANDILQAKPAEAVQDLLRIVFNSSFGIAGLVDVATMVEIDQNDEDFGQTLGYWGLPPGPYLVVPLLGPATLRDGVGRIVDSGGSYYLSLLPIWSSFVIQGVRIVNLRSYYLEEIDENRRESFDYYVFMRNAYLQNRRAEIEGEASESDAEPRLPLSDEDLYFFDDEEMEDDNPRPPEGVEPEAVSNGGEGGR